MEFYQFDVLNNENDRALGLSSIPMLINSQHIVSIKPIRIMCKDEIINGHWIRTSNGKKYRAISIPKELEKLFGKSAHVNSEMIDTIDSNNSEYLESATLH